MLHKIYWYMKIKNFCMGIVRCTSVSQIIIAEKFVIVEKKFYKRSKNLCHVYILILSSFVTDRLCNKKNL